MTGLIETLNVVLPVFLVIAVGYGLRLVRLLNREANVHLTRLVFFVCAPALLFRSVATSPLRETVHLESIATIACVTVLLAVGVYLAAAGQPAARRGVITQGTHRSNMVFVGLPVIVNAFGPDVLGPAAVMIGFIVMVYNFLAVLVLVLPHVEPGAGSAREWSKAGLKVLRNPLILAAGAGLLASGGGVRVPLAIDRCLELVGRIAMPLALISIGVGLDFSKLRSEVRSTALVILLKLVVYPGLIYLGLHWIGLRGEALHFPVLLMAAPTAVVSYVMAQEMKGDEQLAGSIVIGTTLASLVTISGWLLFLRWMAG